MNLLSRCNDASMLEKTLLQLPENINDAYGESMKQIVSRNLNASRCIFWTLYAQRPLTVQELKCAAIFEPQNGAAQKTLDLLEHTLIVETAGLITIEPATQTVHLIHNTAKEYLSGTVARVFFPTARKHIAETCLTVITSDDVVDDCYIDHGATPLHSDASLVEYAATYWGHHASEAPTDENTTQVLIRAFLNKLCWRRPPINDSCNVQGEIPQQLGLGKYFSDWSALHVLAYFGVTEKARRLLEKGDDVDANDNCLGVSALHCAAHGGNEEMVQLLLDHNADIDATCKQGNTALHIAVEQGQRKIVKLLLSKGINSRIANQQGATALHLAVNTVSDEATVPLLIKSRNDMDIQNETTGNSALHIAVEMKRPRILSFLLEKGAALNIANNQGLTPLHLAAKTDNCESICLILDYGVRVEARSLFGLTALHIAASEKNWVAFDLLTIGGADINAWNNDGESLLHEQAREASSSSIAAHLLKQGANLESRSSQGYTPLQCAAMCGNKDTFFFLLKQGAKVDIETSKGESILHITSPSNQNCIEILAFALEYGLDVNAASTNGWTPLHQTVFAGTGSPDLASDKTTTYVKLLLSHGADVNAESVSAAGETPLHLATIAPMPRPSLVSYLIKYGASVDARTKHGLTPSYLAAQQGRESILEILREAGADSSAEVPLNSAVSIEIDRERTPRDMAKQHPIGVLWFDEFGNWKLPPEKDRRESMATTIEEVEIMDRDSETDDEIGGSTLINEEASDC